MMTATSELKVTSRTAAGAANRRTHPRHKMIAPVEVVETQSGKQLKALLVDLSRGGCFLETNSPLPLGTVADIIVSKDEQSFQASAKVAYSLSNRGMGLEFTAVGPQQFKTLGAWIDKTLQDSWFAASRQRGQRIPLRVSVRVSGYADHGARFTEEAQTSEINAHGGSILISTTVKEGQRLVLSHLQTKASLECLVVSSKQVEGNRTLVGVAFVAPNPLFWLVSFPPARQSHRQSDARSTPESLPVTHSEELGELCLHGA